MIRAEDETYRQLPVSMSRSTLACVDDAMTGFFGRVKRGGKAGFPRFKPMSRWRSFGFVEFSGLRLEDDNLIFKPLVAGLKINMHRPVPDGASIKSCTFTKRGRRWQVTLAIEVAAETAHRAPGSAVGLDVGILHLVTTSDG